MSRQDSRLTTHQYWLLGTFIREIDDLGFHPLFIFVLWHLAIDVAEQCFTCTSDWFACTHDCQVSIILRVCAQQPRADSPSPFLRSRMLRHVMLLILRTVAIQ